MHPWRLNQLSSILKQGAVIAYPSETIWGLGCLANHPLALLELALIKRRPLHKGFILLSPNLELCLPYIDSKFHPIARQQLTISNNPTTYLLPKSAQVSALLSGDSDLIAIRLSPHPFVQDICYSTQTPLVSSSANLNNRPSLNSALLIKKHFGKSISFFANGYKNGSGKASTIINLVSGKVLRQ